MALLLLMALPWEASAQKQWRTYENCVLVPNPANDGDSFHVRAGNKRRYLFRLYFADCPESDNSLPERVAEQAAYWGIEPAQAVALGKQATKFTEKFLEKGFTVYSKLADARGRSDKDRDYAVVVANGQDLAVELVRNGLARIHGVGVDLYDGTSERTMWWRLKTAEREAQKEKRGGWGIVDAPASRLRPPPVLPPPARAPAAPSSAPAPTAPVPGPIVERDLELSQTTPVYSLLEPDRLLGHLQKGATIVVLKEEPMNRIRIRFTGASGKVFEAQCRREDLGL